MSKGGSSNSTTTQQQRRIKTNTSKFCIPTNRQQCRICLNRLTIQFFNIAFTIADSAMYILGPILICLASAIIIGLTYVYFRIILPMMAGTNWVYTTGDYNIYWEQRGYAGQGIIQHEEPMSKISLTFLALTTPSGIFHTLLVAFFLINILYNYYQCVITSNSGPRFDVVVRELAVVTGFNYPETNEELVQCKKHFEKKIYDRMQRRRNEMMAARGTPITPGSPPATVSSSAVVAKNEDEESQDLSGTNQNSPLMATTTTSTATNTNNKKAPPQKLPRIHNWQLLSPIEWGYCRYSSQPKPPRSHYDHVTKSLVLNMDHYCPWMFNCVGYFNYRYFFNFLWFVTVALWYGAFICFRPFMMLGTKEYREQVRESNPGTHPLHIKDLVIKHTLSNPYIPTPDERTAVALGFMLCLCLAMAVMCLGGFHLYLTVSAQSTIEFHGNWAKRRNKNWKNPYSAGSWKKNWEMIYGTRYWSLHNRNSSVDDDDCEDDEEKYRYHGVWGVLMAMMPSKREPEFLPLPLNGELVRRRNSNSDANVSKKMDLEMGLPSSSTTSDKGINSAGEETEEFIMTKSKDSNGLVGRTRASKSTSNGRIV